MIRAAVMITASYIATGFAVLAIMSVLGVASVVLGIGAMFGAGERVA